MSWPGRRSISAPQAAGRNTVRQTGAAGDQEDPEGRTVHGGGGVGELALDYPCRNCCWSIAASAN